MKRIIGALALGLAFVGTASATDRSERSTAVPTRGSLHSPAASEGEQPFLANDKLFLWRVHWINHSEKQAGDLARSRSKTDGVSRFGKRLSDDHSRSEEKLLALARTKKVELQLTRDEYQKVRDLLARQMTAQMDLVHEDAEEFDDEFLTHMVDDHLSAIDLLRTYRGKTEDADIRAFIDETLPVLQQHHQIALSLQEQGRERQDVKGMEKGAPSTQPREEPQDKPEEGVDKEREFQRDAEKRTQPPPHEEQRVPPR